MAQNKLLPEKMRQLAQRFRYVFVMIDEVTGDEGGAEFLDGIHRFIQECEFSKYGIHSKIIVADRCVDCRHGSHLVFMTASASRGLSFKRAKHILVDIPHFALEQNLMEILQVICRGRGGNLDLDEKTLTFYLADQLLYLDPNDRELVLKEQLLHILNVLLILKKAILTRIVGSGQLSLRRFRMIPIGGKSIYAAGETFSKQLSDLLDELQKISYPSWAESRSLGMILGGMSQASWLTTLR